MESLHGLEYLGFKVLGVQGFRVLDSRFWGGV